MVNPLGRYRWSCNNQPEQVGISPRSNPKVSRNRCVSFLGMSVESPDTSNGRSRSVEALFGPVCTRIGLQTTSGTRHRIQIAIKLFSEKTGRLCNCQRKMGGFQGWKKCRNTGETSESIRIFTGNAPVIANLQTNRREIGGVLEDGLLSRNLRQRDSMSGRVGVSPFCRCGA